MAMSRATGLEIHDTVRICRRGTIISMQSLSAAVDHISLAVY